MQIIISVCLLPYVWSRLALQVEQECYSSQNYRIIEWIWVGRDLSDHLIPTSCHGQEHLPVDQAAQSPIQPGQVPPGTGQIWTRRTACETRVCRPGSAWYRAKLCLQMCAMWWKPMGLHRCSWAEYGPWEPRLQGYVGGRCSFWAVLVYLNQQNNVCGTLINGWCTSHFSLSC